MIASRPGVHKPLLVIKVEDRRRVGSLLAGAVVWVILGWMITSILAGRGQPFDYAVHNFSLAELRIVLWAGTGFLTLGIVAVGWWFLRLGQALWRDAHAVSFGFRFTPNGSGAFDRLVRWYGGVLVVAGLLLMPLGASLLMILSTCRYMRDI
jgi:hypothetical protein